MENEEKSVSIDDIQAIINLGRTFLGMFEEQQATLCTGRAGLHILEAMMQLAYAAKAYDVEKGIGDAITSFERDSDEMACASVRACVQRLRVAYDQ